MAPDALYTHDVGYLYITVMVTLNSDHCQQGWGRRTRERSDGLWFAIGRIAATQLGVSSPTIKQIDYALPRSCKFLVT